MIKVTQEAVIKFIRDQIIFRFGIPETITANQGTMFVGDKVAAFAQQFGIKMLHSTPYYAQTNGQAEATNKLLISMIKKGVEDQPRKWHETLNEVLWAYKNSRRMLQDSHLSS